MHDGYWHDGGGTWWIPMTIMMIAFWGGLAWVIVTLVRHNAHHTIGTTPATPHLAPPPPPSDARQLLAERLARGDIDVDDPTTWCAICRAQRSRHTVQSCK